VKKLCVDVAKWRYKYVHIYTNIYIRGQRRRKLNTLSNFRPYLIWVWNRSKQTCEFCGKSFSTKLQLNRHSKIHDEQNHVTCSECGKTFNSKGNLKIHLQHCLKEGKFKCQYCPMKFHYKNALKTHLVREHDQEREFECSICGTQFMHKKNYTRIRDLLTSPFLGSGSTTSRTEKFEVEWSMIRHMKRHEENPDKIFRTQSVRNCYKKNNIKFWNKDWDLFISHHSKCFQNLDVALKKADSKSSSFFLDNQEDFLVKGYSLGNPNLHIQR